MNVTGNLLILVSLSITLVSCNQKVKQERIQRIDSLGVHLNYVRETLTDLDSMMLINRINDITQIGNWVYDNVTDTLRRRPGLIFGDFMRSKKYLSQAVERYDEVRRELKFSEQQLATLRKDVENSFYSEEEFSGYFRTESASIAHLVDATEELKEKYEMSNGRYNDLKPKMTVVVDSIKGVIYGSEPRRK